MGTSFILETLIGLLARFGIDIAALLLLVFGMYYRRYHDKELVTAAALVNVAVFAVLAVLSAVDFGIAAGFGLFAILALFTLRSEQLSKTEIAYFFASIAIAVICSVKGTTLPFAGAIVALVLAGTWILDHPRVLRSVDRIRITFDKIDTDGLADAPAMRAELARRLKVEVMYYQIISFDYVNDTATLNVYYKNR